VSHPSTEHTGAGHGHDHRSHGHDHGHGHAHGGLDAAILRSREAMRTLALSLVVLGVTAAVQIVVVVLSGSVALLADTVHNVGDALTAIPLGAAFVLGRRPPSRQFPYGLGRTEDLAGIAVVLIILFSAGYAAYEAIDRLLNPQEPGYLLATALAGVVGFLGNEWVAVYRIRAGRRLGSAALEADGYHARVDGFTSLAVVAGAAGVALGFQLADPIVGLGISLITLRIVWQSAREIGIRALDGVDPELLDRIEADARSVPGVDRVQDVQARWLGHAIRAELAIGLDPDVTVAEADGIADGVRRRLLEAQPLMGDAIVRPLPSGH
jgi:cation diffusion facilitator family transporter